MGKNIVTKGTAVAGRYQAIEVGIPYYEKVAFLGPGTTAETDSSFDVPASAIVTDIFAQVTSAASSAGYMDIGLYASSSGGDADGFADGLVIDTTGLATPALSATTAGQYDAVTLGSLLADGLAGATSYALIRKHHETDSVTAKSLTYSVSTTKAVTGFIYVGLMNLYSSE